MPVCPTCRVGYMEGESHVCGADKNWRKAGSTDARSELTTSSADGANALSERYRDGYRQARFISGFGQFVKIAGAALGALVVVGGVASWRDGSAFGTSVALGSVIGGGVVALMFFVAGVIIAAQGQLLLASLDTAVGDVPFDVEIRRRLR